MLIRFLRMEVTLYARLKPGSKIHTILSNMTLKRSSPQNDQSGVVRC